MVIGNRTYRALESANRNIFNSEQTVNGILSNVTIKITLPNGSIVEHVKGVTGYDIAFSISESLARESQLQF